MVLHCRIACASKLQMKNTMRTFYTNICGRENPYLSKYIHIYLYININCLRATHTPDLYIRSLALSSAGHFYTGTAIECPVHCQTCAEAHAAAARPTALLASCNQNADLNCARLILSSSSFFQVFHKLELTALPWSRIIAS